jgi:NAD(P)-dependent dehydrogenase (short-subunit alcohol dehydrogenase family)
MSNVKPVAVVTGASRGAGRGIAIALGVHGCTVYVTGRTEKAGDAAFPGTIYETAEAVTAAGGKGVAVRVDHGDDAQVKMLFERIEAEQAIVDMLNVGLRSGYVASYFAAPLMVRQRSGLILFTSASGAVHYVYGPAYGAHKAGMDKFAADMAVDFKEYNVAVLSVWMGVLLTDRLKMVIVSDPAKYAHLESMSETPEFTGHILWHMLNDPELMQMSGQTVIGADMAIKYGIQDADGRQPASYRETHKVKPRVQYPNVIR